MKTRLTSMLLLAAALSASAFAATANSATPFGFVASKANMLGKHVELGATDLAVTTAFGKPDQRVSPDLWVYRGFHSDSSQAAAKGCNILLVQFTNGHVTSLKLVNKSAAEATIASLKLENSMGTVATTIRP